MEQYFFSQKKFKKEKFDGATHTANVAFYRHKKYGNIHSELEYWFDQYQRHEDDFELEIFFEAHNLHNAHKKLLACGSGYNILLISDVVPIIQ